MKYFVKDLKLGALYSCKLATVLYNTSDIWTSKVIDRLKVHDTFVLLENPNPHLKILTSSGKIGYIMNQSGLTFNQPNK